MIYVLAASSSYVTLNCGRPDCRSYTMRHPSSVSAAALRFTGGQTQPQQHRVFLDLSPSASDHLTPHRDLKMASRVSPMPLAGLGLLCCLLMLSPDAVIGQLTTGQTLQLPQCATPDPGVCCYDLGLTCTSNAECAYRADSIIAWASLDPNDIGGPASQYGCHSGHCLLLLNSEEYACSSTSTAAACAMCEPVFGASLLGTVCAFDFYTVTEGCCIVQAAGSVPSANARAFKGCQTNADCITSGFSNDLVTYGCSAVGACFYLTDDLLCGTVYNQCGNPDTLETCNAIAEDPAGAPIPNFFPPVPTPSPVHPKPHPKPHSKPHPKPHPKPHAKPHHKPHPKPHARPHPKPHAPSRKG